MVLVVGSELVDNVRKVPDNVMSTEPSSEVRYHANQRAYTNKNYLTHSTIIQKLGILNMNDSFHSGVIRSKVTRNKAAILYEVHEELIMAMDDSIPTRKNSTWQIPR